MKFLTSRLINKFLKKNFSVVLSSLVLVGASILLLSNTLTSVKAQSGATPAQLDEEALRAEIDYFLNEVGAQGYLLWQYSGDFRNTVLGNDKYSFFRNHPTGDKVCEILKSFSNNNPDDKFIGVNMWDLAKFDEGLIDTEFTYLKNTCGVEVVRIFGEPESGGVLGIHTVLQAANNHGIKVIVALADYSNGSEVILPGDVDTNPTPWYQSGYQSGYLDYVQAVSSAIGNHSSLYGYELANEPHCSGQQNCLGPYNAWVENVSSVIRQYSTTRIGIGQKASENTTRGDSPGVGSPSDFTASNSAPNITMTSGHYYNESERTLVVTAKQQSDALGKPFYIGEAGIALGLDRIPYELTEVPCEDTTDPEWHSLRPYPANPCSKRLTGSAMCSNDIVVKETFELTPAAAVDKGCTTNCHFIITSTAEIEIDLTNAELPIAGNTELVPNAEQRVGTLDYSQRVNQYLSWYLNGIPFRAEEPYFQADNPSNLDVLINYSGPIRKLLPRNMQIAQRVAQGAHIGKPSDTSEASEFARHDQIAACETGTDPEQCEPGPKGGFNIWRISRLTVGPLADVPGIINSITSPIRTIISLLQGGAQAFQILPVITGAADNPAFQYVPFTSTEDRQAQAFTEMPDKDQSRDNVTVRDVAFTPLVANKTLYFPHQQANAELADLLQSTYLPDEISTDQINKLPDDVKPFEAPYGCEIKDSRTNPGDSLYGQPDLLPTRPEKNMRGQLTYTAEFNCEMEARERCINVDSITGMCNQYTTDYFCEQVVFAGTGVTSVLPKGEEPWTRLVAGAMSAVRRIFPKTGTNTPIEEFEDIPARTNITYTATGISSKASQVSLNPETEALAGDPGRGRDGSQAEMFFPHLGSVSEYFLEGIQEALRPKGIGNTTVVTTPSTPGMGCNPADFKDFGADAEKVACVCDKESVGGQANALNKGCLRTGDDSTWDYSVGLFQINLLVHPDVAPPDLIRRFKDAGYANAEQLNCPDAFSSIGETYKDGSIFRMKSACVVQDQKLLDICVDYYSIPANNVSYAADLAQRDGWGHWSLSAKACGLL